MWWWRGRERIADWLNCVSGRWSGNSERSGSRANSIGVANVPIEPSSWHTSHDELFSPSLVSKWLFMLRLDGKAEKSFFCLFFGANQPIHLPPKLGSWLIVGAASVEKLLHFPSRCKPQRSQGAKSFWILPVERETLSGRFYVAHKR